MNHCLHIHSRLVKVTAANGVEMFAAQCVTCGNKVTSWLPRKYILFPSAVAEESSKPPTISRLLEDEQQRMRDEYQELRRKAYELRRTFYDNYLQSPQCRGLRQQILRRSGGLCEDCHLTQAQAVHHLTYERLGNELLSDLLAVCDPCHARRHKIEAREATKCN